MAVSRSGWSHGKTTFVTLWESDNAFAPTETRPGAVSSVTHGTALKAKSAVQRGAAPVLASARGDDGIRVSEHSTFDSVFLAFGIARKAEACILIQVEVAVDQRSTH